MRYREDRLLTRAALNGATTVRECFTQRHTIRRSETERAKYHDTRISRRASLVQSKVASKNRGAGRGAGRDHLAACAGFASGKIAGGFPDAAGSADREPGR